MAIANPFVAPPMPRPRFNVGGLFDIQSGRYYKGKHGESILNGGVFYITAIAGRGNTFKSTIAFRLLMTLLDRYLGSTGSVYDTEITASLERIEDIGRDLPRIGKESLAESGRLVLTDKTMYSGTEWFALYKEYLKARMSERKGLLLTTPFIDRKTQQPIQIMAPYYSAIDSYSMFTSDSVNAIQEKGGVGESDRNMEAMRDAMAKTQMLLELPTVNAKGDGYMILTAHVGDQQQLDQYKPNPKKLTFMKADMKIKNTPEKFTFLVNDCWIALGSSPMINQNTKAVEYPRNSDDDLKGDTDLLAITMMNLRGKGGMSGYPFELIVSQSEGILNGLTMFNYIKVMDRFGIGGNDRNYHLELCPDIALSRTTVRGKLRNNAKLERALEITSELCHMYNHWHEGYPEDLICNAKTLYDDIKAKGYDWDLLLNTRGYWIFEEDKHPLPFLSTMDLLNMRAGTYVPFWYPKEKLP